MSDLKVKKCKAAILLKQREDLLITEIELPESLAPGQVLVRVHYSGVCGSQIGEIKGVKGPDNYLPHLLGHEGAGEVVQTGLAVTTVKEGDHVVLHWKEGSGINAATPTYTMDGGKVNAGWVTTFNEYAVISENRLTSISKEMDLKIAALFGCAVTTGFGVVINDAELKPGQSIVVYGAGGIGLSIVQAAALVSGLPIIAVDLVESRLQLARKMGADYTFNASECDVVAEVKALLPEGVDVVVDNTGNPKIIETAYDLTAREGITVLVGVPAKGNDTSLYTLPLHFGKQLKGSFGGGSVPDKDIIKYIRMYDKGRLDLDSLITNDYRLDEINQAIDDMVQGRVSGRCIIDMAPKR
jgi:S-(hydroxymethyl)glutathione dehydrogenase/alcohol dehydrogenase